MKIYAQGYYDIDLDRFIGKDVWVKINYSITPFWVRFLESKEDRYIVNIIDVVDLNNGNFSDIDLPNTIYKDLVHSKFPLEVYSTEELLSADGEW